MSRTTEKIVKKQLGKVVPRKSRKKLKDRKYFGNRYGDGSTPNAKKGVDFMNDGYPLELRHKSVIKQKIEDELLKEKIKDIL
jgi:hypothetical protein